MVHGPEWTMDWSALWTGPWIEPEWTTLILCVDRNLKIIATILVFY